MSKAQPSPPSPPPPAPVVAKTPLPLSGKLFFGSLCVGTFALGVWQVQRFFEKIDIIEQRDLDLQLPPLPLDQQQPSVQQNEEEQQRELGQNGNKGTGAAAASIPRPSFRLRSVDGYFLHGGEILVGPRGSPAGTHAFPGSSSSSKGIGFGGGSGMAAGPQGYYIITPFRNIADQKTVLVNRGWVHRKHIVGQDITKSCCWDRPTGRTQVIGVVAKPEHPRFLKPQHDFKTRPFRFFWMDLTTMADLFDIPKNEAVLLTQVRTEDEIETPVSWPIQPSKDAIGTFRTTPLVHAGYAVSWFGMSAAGVYMTRMLMKGRGF